MRPILFAAAALLGAAVSASAATVPYRSDAELVAIADRVVRGRVIDSVVERVPSGAIVTRTRLAVIEDFTGGTEAVLTISERGGRLPDGTTLWIPGTPRFVSGDDVVVCLERTAGGYRTVSLAFSAFRVSAAVGGDRALTRFGGTAVVGGPVRAGSTAVADAGRSLDEFRRAAAALTGVPARAVLTEAHAAAAVAAASAARVEEPFTLLGGGIRWREADSGQAIAWYRNTLTPSSIEGADTDTQIRDALAGWTAPPAGSITLEFAGAHLVPMGTSGDPYCTDGNLGAGLLTFGDPLNELAVGVLAIGGGCGSASTHVVNGQAFYAFTHGLVVLNDDAALQGFRTVPNITRILEHEFGHAIGLGHTDMGPENIMYPSCCQAVMPVPPAIGPDDLAGLRYIYPVPDVPACTYTLGIRERTIDAVGGMTGTTIMTSFPECRWRAVASALWLQPGGADVKSGPGFVDALVSPNLLTATPRTGTLVIEAVGGGQVQPPMVLTVTQEGDADTNGDGLFDGWAVVFLAGSAPVGETGPSADPDGDGRSNLEEQQAGTHPFGNVRRYLAEGVSNAFFDTEVALFNPTMFTATVLLRMQLEGGGERTWVVRMEPLARRTVRPEVFESLATTPFSTLIESNVPVVVDRTVTWDARGYGSHAETAIEAPSTTWYLAEGSTAGDFQLFYLLQNPNASAVTGTVRFLRPAPLPAIDHAVAIAPQARLTIAVDSVRPELASTDVSAVITTSQPIIAERAMYLSRPGEPFSAGHASAGVTAPATEWFLAEGATGTFFDLFLLIANPSALAAAVRVDYLLPSGTTLSKVYTVAPESRFTVWVDNEQLPAGSGQRPLAATAVAMRVTSTGGVPIIVERAMWWPQSAWYEAHNAAGTTVTGTRWALAGGEAGGPDASETYLLIANTSPNPGLARVTLYLDDAGTQATAPREIALPPNSRTNVAASVLFPESAGRRFASIVESVGAAPVPIVVERAIYASPGGVLWAAGTAVVATRLVP